jgi:hypothetical protein
MNEPLGCRHRIVICLDAGNHLNDGRRRVLLKNPASLESSQISLYRGNTVNKMEIPSLTLPLHTVPPVLPARWKHQIHPGQQ